MKQRIITGLALIAVAIPCIILGGYYLKTLLAVVLILSVYEILHILQRPKVNIYIYGVLALFLASGLIFNLDNLFINSYSMFIYMVVLFTCMVVDPRMTLERTTYIFAMGLLVCSGVHSILAIRNLYGIEYILVVAFANYGSDTGAYFAGKFLGKHKLIPRLSPNKTIEGSIGGIFLGSVIALVYAYYNGIVTEPIMVAAIVLMTMTSQIGDLLFSAIKRTYGVKDYSNLLPGHGGILDRVDSLVFNAIVFSLFLVLVG